MCTKRTSSDGSGFSRRRPIKKMSSPRRKRPRVDSAASADAGTQEDTINTPASKTASTPTVKSATTSSTAEGDERAPVRVEDLAWPSLRRLVAERSRAIVDVIANNPLKNRLDKTTFDSASDKIFTSLEAYDVRKMLDDQTLLDEASFFVDFEPSEYQFHDVLSAVYSLHGEPVGSHTVKFTFVKKF